MTQALAAVFPDDPPRFMARTPHGYHDAEKIRAELTAAGFTAISIDTVEQAIQGAFAAAIAAIAYCQGTPLRNEIEARDASRLEEATQKATEALERRFGSGPVDGRIQAHVISAAGLLETIPAYSPASFQLGAGCSGWLLNPARCTPVIAAYSSLSEASPEMPTAPITSPCRSGPAPRPAPE